jgi:CO/xanthine dehydrogenase Mo-binding subunit
MSHHTLSRRDFVKDAGGLILGFSLLDASIQPIAFAQASRDVLSVPLPDRLDSWLRIDSSGLVHVFSGKVEIGMGIATAYAQIVAEELDVPPDRVSFVLGDTLTTADQGGVGGSTSISLGARPLRNVAAVARAVLIRLASEHLAVAADRLEVRDGLISVSGDGSRTVTYGDLARDGDLSAALNVSGAGFAMTVEGPAKPKDSARYRVVGASLPRVDLPLKLLGRYQFVTDVRVPGMLHGRVVRPSGVGATVVSVDDQAARRVGGFVGAVVRGNFIGVVAEDEWAAVQAAKALKVTWSAPGAAFPQQETLYRYMREAASKSVRQTLQRGDAAGNLTRASKRLDATYEFPFQSHATMGPGCAVADVRRDGVTTVWVGAQKPHAMRKGIAELLAVPLERVRVIWMQDAGSYGRPGLEDTAADAVLLSQAVGRPVRVQWSRSDMTAWGTKGPAVTCTLAAALDERSEVSALQFSSRAFSGGEILYLPATAGNFLAAQLVGIPNSSGVDEFAEWGREAPAYSFPSVDATAHVIAGFHETASPLRTTHLRDPEGPATTFAVESFIDEIAAAAGSDPIAFRLKYLEEPRAKAVLTAAAEKARWEPRPSPKAGRSGNHLSGRGAALSTRNGSYVGTIAEVDIERTTGRVRVTRLVCAHDCGLIINPSSLRRTVEANLIQSLSRSLFEEVAFDRSTVTSVDWRTYPVARASDIPARVEVVLLNRPELPPGGAGEPSSRATTAAIANAIFDASGARVRQAPLTPPRVRAALEQA